MSEIKNMYTGAVICSGECSVKELVEANKANLCGVDLFGSDLRGSDLRGSDLRGSDLFGADLGGAELYKADLRGAKYGEEELLQYLSIGPDYLQVFITTDNIHLRTGCWSGSPEELLERTDREDYKLAVQYIFGMAEMVRKEVQGE